MVKEDPLHRLSRTTTTAFRNQQYTVWKESEKDRVQEIPQWGTPSKATPSKTSASPLPRCATLGPASTRATPKKSPPAHHPQSSTKSPAIKPTNPTKPSPSTTTSQPRSNLKFQNATTPTKPASATSASRTTTPVSNSHTAPARTPRIPTVVTTTSTPGITTKTAHDDVRNMKLPDKQRALQIFDQLDENASGKMSLAELDKGIVMLYPELNHKPAIMRAFHATDASGNGFIERDEFPYCLSYLAYYNNLWTIFTLLDEDGDRRITKKEFLKVATKLDLDRDAEQVFGEIDVNGGGMILFDELCHWLTQNKAELGANENQVVDLKKRLQDLETRKASAISAPAPVAVKPIPQAVMKIDAPDKSTSLKVFDQLDGNASGKLSLAELDKGVITLYPQFNNKKAIMAAYKAADRSGDGFVSRNEFGYFLQFIVYYNNLWAFFSALDNDSDRRISKDEFMKAAPKLDLGRDANAVFAEIDTNGGGLVLFDEFCNWMAVNKSSWGSSSDDVSSVTASFAKITINQAKETEKDFEPELIPEGLQNVKIPPDAEVMELFDRLDENASGKLSLAELDKGIVMSYPALNNKPAIMAAYKAADRNGDGFINRSDFGYFVRFVVYYNNLWQVFESVDMDGDRRISKEEFVKAANKLDLVGDANKVFDEMDTNKGGMVLFGEMIQWFAENKSDWTSSDNQVF